MEKIELTVKGMSCGHCEKVVANALMDMGASKVIANKDSASVVVEFDPAVLSADDIKRKITEAGYEAE